MWRITPGDHQAIIYCLNTGTNKLSCDSYPQICAWTIGPLGHGTCMPLYKDAHLLGSTYPASTNDAGSTYSSGPSPPLMPPTYDAGSTYPASTNDAGSTYSSGSTDDAGSTYSSGSELPASEMWR